MTKLSNSLYSLDEWYDALDEMELGDSGTLNKEGPPLELMEEKLSLI